MHAKVYTFGALSRRRIARARLDPQSPILARSSLSSLRRMRSHALAFTLALATVTSAGCAAFLPLAAQTVALPPFLEMRVPKAPTVANGDSGSFLAYELHVTNLTAQPVTIRRVEATTASGDRRVLLALADTALERGLARPGIVVPFGERARLGPGLRGVVFLWVPVDGRTPPDLVRHRITIAQGQGDSAQVQALEGAAVTVSRPLAPIGPPLRGGPWLVGNGPSNASGHRRALIPVDGMPAIAQRYAIDYVQVDSANRTFRGDRLKNESYYAEGLDALAVADGMVVAVKDSIPENVPGINSRAVPITLETVGGNHVIVDIGGGRFAFYAHLKPGSIRVRNGERVRRGQVLGLVGNSGNSTEPHLHFHLSDGNSPLGSEGVPYQHASFDLVGVCRGFGGACSRTAPRAVRSAMPLANMLVRFP